MYALSCKLLCSLHLGKSTASLICMQAPDQAAGRQGCRLISETPRGSWQGTTTLHLEVTQIVIKLKELT